MQEGRASRWSFLQPPTVAAGAEAAPARPGRRAVRSRAGRAADAAAQEAACPAAAEEQQQGFVFMATPGGASLGAKAAHSSARKHTPHRGAGSPGTPFDGSPMQWSPAVEGELGEGRRAGATPGSGSSASASRDAWACPGSNANIAPPAGADGIAVELLARLHLGGDGGGAQENLPQAQASKPPSPAEQQPAEVPPPAEASSAEPVAAEFVFAAQGSCSPAQRQRQPGRSPVGGGRRKPAAPGAGGAPPPSPATAGPTAAPAPAPQPPIPPPSTAACFVFEARQPAAPRDGDSASAQREPPASSQPPVPFPSAAAAAAEPPQFVYGAAALQSAAPGDGARKPAAAAASAAAPPFVFGGSQQPAAAAPGNAAAPFVFAGQPLGAAAAAVPAAPAVAEVQSAGPAASEASCSGSEAAPQEHQQPLSKAVRKFRRRPTPALSSSAAQPAGAVPGAGLGPMLLPSQPGASLFAQAASSGSSGPGVQQAQPPPVLANLAQEMVAASRSESERNLGNEAFKAQDYQAALEAYTKAIKALWPYPALHPRLALLLSNRAAALLSLGKPFQALKDCNMGLKYDPNFSRCALRIATCYCRLGDFEAAEAHLRGMERSSAGDKALLAEIEAKLEEVAGHRERVLSALRKLGHTPPSLTSRNCSGSSEGSSRRQPPGGGQGDEESVRGGLADLAALWAHVPHAEYLHAGKAQALLRIGSFKEAVEACHAPVHYEDAPGPASALAPWRLWLEAQCSYHGGDYSSAGRLLQQLQEARRREATTATAAAAFGERPVQPVRAKREDGMLAAVVAMPTEEELAALLADLEAAQRLRQTGNALMKQRKYVESVATYTEALAVRGLSAAFASILHSNRAAAHQGLEQWVQAVADCCRSKALWPAYSKAHSRLATLLSELRLHDAAARALEAALKAPALSASERRDYEARLRDARAEAQKRAGPRLMGSGGGPRQPDHYKLLSLQRSCTVDEVRKAYKRVALQLHPDKVVSACRYSLQLTEAGAVVLPAAQAAQRLQEDAKWLFQCLGEAHEVLTDKSKRAALDAELHVEERFSGVDGDFYSSGRGSSCYGSGVYGYSPNSFAERVRRAAQQRQQAGARWYQAHTGWRDYV